MGAEILVAVLLALGIYFCGRIATREDGMVEFRRDYDNTTVASNMRNKQAQGRKLT